MKPLHSLHNTDEVQVIQTKIFILLSNCHLIALNLEFLFLNVFARGGENTSLQTMNRKFYMNIFFHKLHLPAACTYNKIKKIGCLAFVQQRFPTGMKPNKSSA